MNNREVSHYVVTAHPPGGVLHTVKCNFLNPDSEVRLRLLSLKKSTGILQLGGRLLLMDCVFK